MTRSKFEEITDNMDDFATEHPVAYLAIACLGGLAVCMPLCALAYRYIGKVQGRECAKELMEAGVVLGYNHD
jgi:hypothetical protein